VVHGTSPDAGRPPSVVTAAPSRRDALRTGGVLGIGAMLLPAAAAHASSSPESVPAAAVPPPGATLRVVEVDAVDHHLLTFVHDGEVGEQSVFELDVTEELAGVSWVAVAGGGAGGSGRGGGGGAGGLRIASAQQLVAGVYQVRVGGGGVATRVVSGTTTGYTAGGDGLSSGIDRIGVGAPEPIVAVTGGGGGGAQAEPEGRAGGSGGGGGNYLNPPAGAGAGTLDEGKNGSASGTAPNSAGGGGGREQRGGTADGANARRTAAGAASLRADGGDGLQLSDWCIAARASGGPAVGEEFGGEYYLAGGGGGFYVITTSDVGLPGVGGGRGGYGGKSVVNETLQDGLAHTGGGGGGLEGFYAGGAPDDASSGGRAGHGGSGVVMLRWPVSSGAVPGITRPL
jgi:hypothetical protein